MTRYRVLVGLTVPVDAREDARIRKARDAGNPLPHEERHTVRVEAGVIADYIPALSLPWLLAQGKVEEVPE